MAFLKRKSLKKEGEKETETPIEGHLSRGSVQGGNVGSAGVLLYPHMTEKTVGAASRRMYAFVVAYGTNKQEVKKAIQSRYGVNVIGVRMVTIRGKEIHRGKQIGWKQGMKKAYATIAEGQTIEIQ